MAQWAPVFDLGNELGFTDLECLMIAALSYPPLKHRSFFEPSTELFQAAFTEKALAIVKRSPIKASRYMIELYQLWRSAVEDSDHAWTDALIINYPEKSDKEIAALDLWFRSEMHGDHDSTLQCRVRAIEKRRERLSEKLSNSASDNFLRAMRLIHSKTWKENLAPELDRFYALGGNPTK